MSPVRLLMISIARTPCALPLPPAPPCARPSPPPTPPCVPPSPPCPATSPSCPRLQDPTGEAASVAQKHLTYYELDLGLNHVTRKWTDPVDNGANLLIAVPGGADGPGGVLVCAENFIIYKNQGHEEVRAVIPRRHDLPGDRGVLIVSYATHKKKAYSFFLVQVCTGRRCCVVG